MNRHEDVGGVMSGQPEHNDAETARGTVALGHDGVSAGTSTPTAHDGGAAASPATYSAIASTTHEAEHALAGPAEAHGAAADASVSAPSTAPARQPAAASRDVYDRASTQARLPVVSAGRAGRTPRARGGGNRARRRAAQGVLVALVTLFSLLGLFATVSRSMGLVPVGPLSPLAPTPGAAFKANTGRESVAQNVAASAAQGCVNGVPPVVAPRSAPIRTASGLPGIGNEVALTFDDGPSPLYTPQILAALHEGGAHATFFVVGRHILAYPGLVRAEWLAGNAIGNHTFLHEYVPGLRPDQLHASLTRTADAIRAETGDPCLWLFRPPYGDLALSVTAVASIQNEGYTSVNWDVRSQDWLRPGADVIAQRTIDQLRPGAIILLHDSAPDNENPNRSQTAAALPKILAAIRAKGLRTVTLPQLFLDAGLAHPAVSPPSAPQTPMPRACQTAVPTLGDADVQQRRQRACDQG